MKNLFLLGTGALFLVIMLALPSFAATAARPTPTAVAAVGGSGTDGADQAGSDLARAPAAPINPGNLTSRIMVYNPNAGTALVSIRIINPNGTDALSSPMLFNVPTQGVGIKTLPTSLPSPFRGSALVSSDKSVQALVLNKNSDQTARDMYSGTLTPSATLTLPFVRHLAAGTQNSVIAVQNTGQNSADITMTLYDANGNSVVAPQTKTGIAPLASAYFNTNQITFPTGTFTGTAVLSASGNAPLAASEETRYQLDTAAFRAIAPGEQDTTLYVNMVHRKINASGLLHWNELYVRNESANPTYITVQYFSTTGTPTYSVTTPSQVPANGMASFLTSASSFSSLGNSFVGWAKISSGSSSKLSAYSLEAWNGATRLLGYEGVPSSQTGVTDVCGDVLKSTAQNSKFTILNTDTSATANVTVKLFNPTTGVNVASKTVAVPPLQVVSVGADDPAFVKAGTTFEDMALVKSDGALIVTSLYTPYISTTTGGVASYNCAKLK